MRAPNIPAGRQHSAEMLTLRARLAEQGVPLDLAGVGPGDPLPAALVPRRAGVSLSAAVIEERDESHRRT